MKRSKKQKRRKVYEGSVSNYRLGYHSESGMDGEPDSLSDDNYSKSFTGNNNIAYSCSNYYWSTSSDNDCRYPM